MSGMPLSLAVARAGGWAAPGLRNDRSNSSSGTLSVIDATPSALTPGRAILTGGNR